MTANDLGYDYMIDADGRVTATYWADLTIDILNDLVNRIKLSPKNPTITCGLSDFTRCSSAELSIGELEAHLGHVKKGVPDKAVALPWALVAPDPFIFGLSRQYSSMAETLNTPYNYYVCKTCEEATAWLDAQTRGN